MSSCRLPLLLTAAVLLSAGVPSASARLGETREECIARYGEPIADLPPFLKEANALSFIKNRVRIWVEFLEGKAVFVSFSRRGMKPEDRQKLLDANRGDLSWGNQEEFLGRKFWLARSGSMEESRHATHYNLSEIGVLEFALQPWVDAMKEQKAAPETTDVTEAAPAVEAAVPAAGAAPPLPGKVPAKPAPSSSLEGF